MITKEMAKEALESGDDLCIAKGCIHNSFRQCEQLMLEEVKTVLTYSIAHGYDATSTLMSMLFAGIHIGYNVAAIEQRYTDDELNKLREHKPRKRGGKLRERDK